MKIQFIKLILVILIFTPRNLLTMECGKSLEKILQDGELKESLISISHDNSVNEENTAYFNLSLHS